MYKLTVWFEYGSFEKVYPSNKEAMIEHLYLSTLRKIFDYEIVCLDKGLH